MSGGTDQTNNGIINLKEVKKVISTEEAETVVKNYLVSQLLREMDLWKKLPREECPDCGEEGVIIKFRYNPNGTTEDYDDSITCWNCGHEF